MPGPVNGIVGEENPTELPQTQVDDSQLKEMQKTAKFAKSAEYKELKRYLTSRIEFYQKYLPNGRAVGANGASVDSNSDPISMEEMAQMWVVANVITGELNAIMNTYDNAAEYVKDYAASKQ